MSTITLVDNECLSHAEVATVDLEFLASFDEAQEEGEPDFVVELIELYLDEAPRIFSTIRDGLTGDDWLSAKRAAHSLRGSSSNLGILRMAAIADNLEHLPVPNDGTALLLLGSLEEEFRRVEEILLGERQRRTS
jgi:HPt (histidine-containing phosphotransfer) domain-containing protein